MSNAIAALGIFPHYSFDLGALYGSGKEVVVYSLLCNHVPLNGWLMGANEYETHPI